MKKIASETNILKWVTLLPVLSIIISSAIITYIFIVNEHSEIEKNIELETKKVIIKSKDGLKDSIERINQMSNESFNYKILQSKNEIKNLTEIGYKIIAQIYETNKNLPKEQILKIIKERLRDLRFFNDGSGYYLIYEMNGNCVLLPTSPDFEGYNLYYISDIDGKYIIKDIIDMLKVKKEGFDRWKWYKNDEKDMKYKTGYSKLFEPLNIFVTTAKYDEDLEEIIENETVNIFSSIKYDNQIYLYSFKKDGTILSHGNDKFKNKNIFDEIKNKDDLKNLLDDYKTIEDGKFLEYEDSEGSKIAYFKLLANTDIYIAKEENKELLNKEILEKVDYLSSDLYNTIQKTILVSLASTLVVSFFVMFILNNLKRLLKNYQSEINEKNHELEKFNEKLQIEIDEEVQKNLKKDRMLQQQAKLASMGEMIGNIAHQWRQPLSAISSSASSLKVQNDLGILETKDFDKSINTIMDYTNYLSNTIEDFRNFFRPDKKPEDFSLKDIITQELNLIEPIYKNYDVNIIVNLEANCLIYGHKNEFLQAVLNILNNAKDAVVSNNDVSHRYIFITSIKNSKKVILSIKDNGGGIDEEIMDKIFEPYFTTKFKSQGTGIGLFMTRQILEKHMNTSLNIRNVEFRYDEHDYKGLEFNIVINTDEV